MSECVFCAIVQMAAEASRVYEDNDTLAFMNLRQGNPGHVLVIPKAHIETIDALDLDTAAALSHTLVKVAQAIQIAFKPDGLNVWQSNRAAAGQEIPHVHFQLLPRWEDDHLIQFYTRVPPYAERAYLDELAEQIRAAL